MVYVTDDHDVLSVDLSEGRAGDIAQLLVPRTKTHLPSCLHIDYMITGSVVLEMSYRDDNFSYVKRLLCTLTGDASSDVSAWNSVDIKLPAGDYQLYFDAIILSMAVVPDIHIDAVHLLDENCSSVFVTGQMHALKLLINY